MNYSHKIASLKKLWALINADKKKKLSYLVFFSFIVSVLEVLTIGSVVPFISSILAPENFFKYEFISRLISNLFNYNEKNLFFITTILFALVILFSGIARHYLLKYSIKLSYDIGLDLDILAYKFYIYQDYEDYINWNSSNGVNLITKKNEIINSSIILAAVSLITSSMITVGVLLCLLYLNIYASLSILIIFGLIFRYISKKNKVTLHKNGETISINSELMIKKIQESFRSFRDITIDKAQEICIADIKKYNEMVRNSESSNAFISQSPKIVIETTGMIFLVLTALLFYNANLSRESIISVLGIIAISGARLGPLLQQIYFSLSNLNSGLPILDGFLKTIKIIKKNNNQKPITFDKNITLKNIYYKYPNQENYVLKGINLTINKGERIGFVGKSGSGKSTLIDIVLGFLNPTKGQVLIDGIKLTKNNRNAWFDNIAHVPQAISLIDSTIKDNIFFNSKTTNNKKLISILKQSDLYNYVFSLKRNLGTYIGEMGIRISGGQRQRLAIARGLYKDSDLLILDEATNALDSDGESIILSNIMKENKTKTIIMITHRQSSLSFCDRVFQINNGGIEEVKHEKNSRLFV